MDKEIKDKITELMTVWADKYLDGKPVAFTWALNAVITREIEKATKTVKEIK